MSITKQLPEITSLTKIAKLPRHSGNVKFRTSRKKFKCFSLHEIQLRHLQHKGILDVYAPLFIHPLKDTIRGKKSPVWGSSSSPRSLLGPLVIGESCQRPCKLWGHFLGPGRVPQNICWINSQLLSPYKWAPFLPHCSRLSDTADVILTGILNTMPRKCDINHTWIYHINNKNFP